jgi:hypothetical protein
MIKYNYRDIRWNTTDPIKERETMPNVNDMFSSNYLTAGDLKKKAHKLVMGDLKEEEVGDTKEKKWILHFKGKDKGLVLNKTNTNMIAEYYGPETDAWDGKEVIVYPTKTSFQGKPVDCIRVRVEPEVTEVAADDGDIPF